MQPRWKKDSGTSNWVQRGYIYLGGTANYDLWIEPYAGSSGVQSLRIVCGDKSSEWDFIAITREPDRRNTRTYFNDVQPTDEEIQEIFTYLQLFAPWALEAEGSLRLGDALTNQEEQT